MNRKDGLITSTNQDVECFGRGRVRGSVLQTTKDKVSLC